MWTDGHFDLEKVGSDLLWVLFTDVGAPFVMGLAVGYFVKKMLKTTLFLAGMFLTLLFIGESLNWLELKERVLIETTSTLLEGLKAFLLFLYERLSRIALKGLSAGAGFIVGLKLG